MKALVRKHFRWFTKKLRSDSVDSYSAQVSFFIIISFIPFLMLVISLLQTVNINGISLLTSILDLLPKSISEFLKTIFDQNLNGLTIVSISAVACIWSSSMAMLALIKGLNSVFDVAETRNIIWLRAVSILYTIAFVVIIIFTAVLLVFGNTIYKLFLFNLHPIFSYLLDDFKFIAVFIILALFFTFSFKIIPIKSKIKLRFCMIGGSLSALAWVLYSFFFSIFVENFGNYSSVYGSLAALVILMLWLYFCMYIMFIGGEVAVWLQTGGIITDFKKLKEFKNKRNKK